jgi:hypothetical protein
VVTLGGWTHQPGDVRAIRRTWPVGSNTFSDMTVDGRAPASAREDRLPVGDEVAALIRRRDFDTAEQHLAQLLTAYPGPIATACRGVRAGCVDVRGWDELDEELVRASAAGVPVTAIGLDLSNYSDSFGLHWWDKEPVVEVSFYGDEAFPFSTASRADVRRATADLPAPWAGKALPGERGVLAVEGLRAANGALLRGGSGRPWSFGATGKSAEQAAAERLGWWWVLVQYHRAMATFLELRELPQQLPVLVGQRGLGPGVVTMHWRTDGAVETAPDVEPATGSMSAARRSLRGFFRR